MATLMRKRNNSGSVPGETRTARREVFIKNICSISDNNRHYEQNIQVDNYVSQKAAECFLTDSSERSTQKTQHLNELKADMCRSNTGRRSNFIPSCEDQMFVSQLLKSVVQQSCKTVKSNESQSNNTSTIILRNTNSVKDDTLKSASKACSPDQENCHMSLKESDNEQRNAPVDCIDITNSIVQTTQSSQRAGDLTFSRTRRQSIDNIKNHVNSALSNNMEDKNGTISSYVAGTNTVVKDMDQVIDEAVPGKEHDDEIIQSRTCLPQQVTLLPMSDLQPSKRRSSTQSEQNKNILSWRKKMAHSVVNNEKLNHKSTRLSQSFDEGSCKSFCLNENEQFLKQATVLQTPIDFTRSLKTRSFDQNTNVQEKSACNKRSYAYMSSPALLIGSSERCETQIDEAPVKRRCIDSLVETNNVPIIKPEGEDGKRQSIIQEIHHRIANVNDAKDKCLTSKITSRESNSCAINIEELEQMIPLATSVNASVNFKRQSSVNEKTRFLNRHHSSGTIWDNVVFKFLKR